jgi:probable F420-dependent oxidoreductase
VDAPVHFGYLVPTREAVMRAADGRADIGRMLELAARAETSGFDSVWVGDSILARPRFEALTTLAAIAARTTRVQLGTAVYLTPLRHPVPLAHTVANLDLLAGGRFLFGIGLGPNSPAVHAEYAACGADYRKRGLLQEEGLQIMKGLWTGEPFSFGGRFYKTQGVKLHPLPARAGGPPILMAAAADLALKRLVRFADGWLPISPNAKSYSQDWERIQQYCSQLGRDPSGLLRILYVTLNVNSDEGRARREMEEFLESYYGAHHAHISQSQGICAGGPQRCAEFLREFMNVGVARFVIRFASANHESQMGAFLSEVAPMLSRAGRQAG